MTNVTVLTNVTVWLMVILNSHGSTWSTGPEFTSREKCETAAKVLYQHVDNLRWGMIIMTPTCVRIDK